MPETHLPTFGRQATLPGRAPGQCAFAADGQATEPVEGFGPVAPAALPVRVTTLCCVFIQLLPWPELTRPLGVCTMKFQADPAMPLPPPIKGRGTVWAIEHRFARDDRESVDDGWGTLAQASQEERLPPGTQIIEERVKSILASNDSPDISFDLSINPYRGCEHGCVYCFARPTHSYLNMSPGLDFETRIIAKVNAAERLREAFASRSAALTLAMIRVSKSSPGDMFR